VIAARGLLVLAMIAALMGAPSVASGAANVLVNAQASPSTGTVDTEFTLAVTFDGRSAALAVQASVAGRVLDMGLVSGTSAAGTWRVRTTLPAGTWPVVFSAIVERGNPPMLTGLTLTVTMLDTPPPTIDATEPADEQPNDTPATPDQPTGGTNASTAPDEPATPIEEGTTSDSPDALPAVTPPPAMPAGTAAAVGTPAAGANEEAEQGTPAEQLAPAATAPSARPAPAADDETAGEPDPAAAVEEVDLLAMVVLIGLAGVAAVAIGGTALLIAMRRREQRADGPPTSTNDARAGRDAEDERGVGGMADRQALRRARLQMTDDPIMTALGIDEDIAGRRARRRANAVTRDRDAER
jgi:hypothetical protein